MLRKRLFELGLLVALLAGMLFSVGLPVQAQDAPPPDDGEGDPVTVEITGEVAPDSATGEISVGEGGITVGGVKIAPAGAFQPSDYKLGDCVTVTGVLLNSDVLQATDIEPAEGCESSGEGEGEGNGEQEQDQDQDQDRDMDGCDTSNQPVLEAYASEFGLSYEELAAWHCENMGLGEIGRALLMAEASGDVLLYTEILDARANGDSWGQIKKDYGIKGGDLAPGRVISGHHEVQGDPQEGESVGPGNSENAHGQSADNPGHGGTPPGQDKEKDKEKSKEKENPGQGGGKKK